MASNRHRKIRTLCGRCFLCFSLLAAMVILGVAGLVLYTHEVGFPGWIRDPVLNELKSKNLAADFDRLRWRLHRGLVAERLKFRRMGEADGQELFVQEAQLQWDWSTARWNNPPGIRGLKLHGGVLRIPLGHTTNSPVTWFEVTDIEARIRFINPELWELDELRGNSLGMAFDAAGSLTNVSQLRSLKAGPVSSFAWREDLREWIIHRNEWVFRSMPGLKLAFHFDLRYPEAATADLRFEGAGFDTDWSHGGPFRVDVGFNQPPGTNGLMSISIQTGITNLTTSMGRAGIVRWDLDTEQSLNTASLKPIRWTLSATRPMLNALSLDSLVVHGQTVPTSEHRFDSRLTLEGIHPSTLSARVRQFTAETEFSHGLSPTNREEWPKNVEARISASGLETELGTIDAIALDLSATGRFPDSTSKSPIPWQDGWIIHSSFRGEGIQLPSATLGSADGVLRWQDGLLSITQMRTRIYGGDWKLTAAWRPANREFNSDISGQLEVARLPTQWLESLSARLKPISWEAKDPVRLRLSTQGTLPNPIPPMGTGVAFQTLPHWVEWEGEVHATNLTVNGLPISAVDFLHRWDRSKWTISEGRILRPEGSLEFSGKLHGETYNLDLKSSWNPLPILSALRPSASNVIQRFQFGQPPELTAHVEGRWNEPGTLKLAGQLESREASYRDERADLITAPFRFTNGWFHVGPVWARQGTNTVNSEAISYQISTGLIYFTNTYTTIDPSGVFAALGPRTFQSFEPFEFPRPPRVVMNGVIPTLETRTGADVRFDAEVPEFRWTVLAATNLTATLWWHDGFITVTNLVGGFHGGRISGNLSADIGDTNDTVFRFDVVIADSQLRSLLRDVTPQTNRIEGWLDGRLTVIEAHSRTNGPWKGQGTAKLKDGYLWDLPLFGGVSKMLDRVVPGIGQTRFNSGTATFSLTNRSIITRDLELNSPTVRLLLAGSVDFDTRLNGRLEANIFNEVPLLGPLVNLVLKPVTKLLEYDVKGYLSHPDMELRHIPGFLLAPLHPVETLRELLPGEKSKPVPAPPSEPTGGPGPKDSAKGSPMPP